MGFQSKLKKHFRNRAVLLLGANLGDPLRSIREAEQQLEKHAGLIVLRSPLYRSEPWGNGEQPVFMNRALLLATPLPPEFLLKRMLEVERTLGRIRRERWGPRTIDIDMLCYGNRVYKTESLTLPHPSLSERRFALLPMSKVAPDWRHPEFGKTTLQLLDACPDPLKVWGIRG